MAETSPRRARPFTREGYRSLLGSALRSGYEFLAFDDVRREEAARVCLLRHDVDVDLGAALELAKIEASLGVKATYFIMLRSAFYSPFARANEGIVHDLIGLGHAIGLHYDIAYAPPGPGSRAPADAIEHEAAFLEDAFRAPVRAVSFHQPSFGPDPSGIRPQNIVSAWNVPGFAYLSDTNKAAAVTGVEELFASGTPPHLQLLIHPIWWATDDPDASTEERFNAGIIANLERMQEQMLATERAFGAPRAFVIEQRSVR